MNSKSKIEYHEYIDYFGERLAKLRMAKNISAQKLSEAVGLSRGYISQIERKTHFPSMNEFFYICDELGITYDEFFKSEVDSPAIYLELMLNAKGLNEEQLTSINNVVKEFLKTNKGHVLNK